MVKTGIGRVWLELARVSNLPTVWTNVMAGWILAGGGFEQSTYPQLIWLLIGGSLLYTGGMFLNDAADAKWDREHRSERPIATGRVGEKAVWIASVVFILAGLLLAVLLGGASWIITLALGAAIVAYDLYHKPWKGSVIIMGACRVLLYLMAGSAVIGGITWQISYELIIKALALGGYIVGLSLVARSEAVKNSAGFGMKWLGLAVLHLPFSSVMLSPSGILIFLAVIFIVLVGEKRARLHGKNTGKAIFFRMPWNMVFVGILVMYTNVAIAASLPPHPLGFTVIVSVLCGAALFYLVRLALYWMATPPPSNIGKAVGLLLASIPVVDALAIAPHAPWLALAFMGSMPLLRLWQRKISAT